jgi:hypothetical protein
MGGAGLPGKVGQAAWHMYATQHVDWNDETVPIGKRKVAFVKWLMQARKVPMKVAKAMANSKFGK